MPGGVHVAVANVPSNSVPDLILAPGPGSPLGGLIEIYSGSQLIANNFGNLGSVQPTSLFFVFGAPIKGLGLNLAAGNLGGTGDSLVIGTDGGGLPPIVVIYSPTALQSSTPSLSQAFLPFLPGSLGANVAVADINGTGDVIVTPAFGGLPLLDVYFGSGNPNNPISSPSSPNELTLAFGSLFPASLFTGGVSVTAGDFAGNGQTELVVGSGNLDLAAVYNSNQLTSGSFGTPTIFSPSPLFNAGVNIGTTSRPCPAVRSPTPCWPFRAVRPSVIWWGTT